MESVKVGPVVISVDDLTEATKRIAEVIGLQNTVALCEAFGGEKFYIPPPPGNLHLCTGQTDCQRV